MLVLTTKQYEIEETIKAENEAKETIYEFEMQLTSSEVKEVQDIIFNRNQIKKAKQLAKLDELSDDYDKLEEEVEKEALELQDRFENICFKEDKEPFKETVGEYKYLEMVEMLYDFFWNAFIEKKAKQVNTMNTSLQKLGGK